MRTIDALSSACAVNRPTARRTLGMHTGPEATGGNPVRKVQSGAVGERDGHRVALHRRGCGKA